MHRCVSLCVSVREYVSLCECELVCVYACVCAAVRLQHFNWCAARMGGANHTTEEATVMAC